MKKFSIALVALAAALAISPIAKADSISFSYTSPGSNFGTGTLTGFLSGGNLDLTGGTLTVDGVDAGSYKLYTGNPSPWSGASSPDGIAYDNVIYLSLPFIDNDGLLFTPTGGGAVGGFEINIYNVFNGPDGWDFLDSTGFSNVGDFETFPPTTTTPTPEPSSMLLLGTGLIGLAFLAFRKAKSASQPSFSLGAF